MPVLGNAKHERFAQQLAQGKTAVDAHEIAGYVRDDGNASKLASNKKVQARVQEITGKAAEKVGVTVERVMTELAKIGFCNMLDYMRAGPDGDPYLDFSSLTRDQAASLTEVVVEDFKDGRGDDARDVRRIKFKLADKRAALVDLGKHLGMFKDRVEHTGKDGDPLFPVTDAERVTALCAFLARAKLKPD